MANHPMDEPVLSGLQRYAPERQINQDLGQLLGKTHAFVEHGANAPLAGEVQPGWPAVGRGAPVTRSRPGQLAGASGADRPHEAEVSGKWEEQGAQWDPAAAPENPPVRAGRPPAMSYLRWHRSQGVDIGFTAPQESWWRCRTPHCRRFAGPYMNPMNASRDGTDHVALAHPEPVVVAPPQPRRGSRRRR